jgi:chemotaxis receptor (MCP) glutamine deamidase CheD
MAHNRQLHRRNWISTADAEIAEADGAGAMMSTETIRETLLGQCIGATILDITTPDADEFLAGGPNHVYFHLGNGETIFATLGDESNPGLVGLLDTEDDEEEV